MSRTLVPLLVAGLLVLHVSCHRSRHAAEGAQGAALDSSGPAAWPDTWTPDLHADKAKRKGLGHREKKKTALNKSDIYGQWVPSGDRHHNRKF